MPQAVPNSRRIRRIAFGLIGIAALALLIGTVTESLTRRRVGLDFPINGRLVDIGGRSIQLDCRGAGSPTVVLEAGLDVLGSLSWASVHDSLATITRTCAYSRAGILWSDPSDLPFSVSAVVADLHLTLERAAERAPFVMVGHSIGGIYATEFTRRFGADVVGVVLVDASHPDQVVRLEAATAVGMIPSSGPASMGARLARTGVLRLMPVMADPAAAPAVVREAASAHLPVSIAALARELKGLRSSLDEARDFRELGDLPLVVLTAGAPTPSVMLEQLGISAQQGERMRSEWIDLQEERSKWSSAGRHVLLAGASHYAQFDQPDAVVRAVREVVGHSQATLTQRRGGKWYGISF